MANLFLTGSGLPSPAIGEVTDYYRDTGTNLIYYRSPTGWEAVPSLIPTPDGIGTTWYHGTGAPNSGLGASNDYYRDEEDGTVYRKHAVNGWESKGSLDFIGVYGVQWGEGSGAPANIPPFNNLPAGSFYLDVVTSDIYYKNQTLVWELKGQLGGGGGGGGGSVTIIDNLTSTSTTAALSANQGNALDSRLQTVENAQAGYGDIVTYNASAFDSAGSAAAAESNAKTYTDSVVTSIYKFQTTYNPQTTGNFPTTANTVGGVAIKKGFTWVVSGVTGQYTFQGVTVDNGDTLLALVDDASSTSAADWHITEKNLGYTPENSSNKYSDNDLAGGAGTYPATPSVKAYVDNGLSGKQNTLADVITAGTYGSASKIPRATYNAKGIVTGITEVDLVAGITPVAYTNGTAYTVGQVVSFNNNLYRVVTAHTAGATPNGDIDLIGDVCKEFVGSSFTAYRLSNLANPAANKTLEVWGSGTSFTLDLVNAPSKVIFRTTNGYNVTALTISRAGSTFYYNRSGTSVGSNAVSLNVVGGCTLEISVHTSEVLVHVIQQPTIQGFKLVDTTTAGSTNVGVSFAGSISADVVYTLANKALDFGKLSFVATTDSNVLGGTDCRIEGGTNNNVSGTMSSTYNCKYHTVVGTYNKAMLSIPTSGTGVFTHAGSGNTYFGHTHTGNTTAVATTNCTFYNCFQSVGHSSDVNVVYRSAGSGSGSGFLGFMPHTQVTGNGVSSIPLKALCMLKSAAVATGVSTTLVSPVSGAVIDKPPLIRPGGNGAVHDIVFNCYDTNLLSSPRYMLCLRRQVTVFYDSSTPVIAQATIGTDLNPAGLTYSIAISLSGTNRMLITVTATDPVSPAPPFPLTYEWSAIVESSYF